MSFMKNANILFEYNTTTQLAFFKMISCIISCNIVQHDYFLKDVLCLKIMRKVLFYEHFAIRCGKDALLTCLCIFTVYNK